MFYVNEEESVSKSCSECNFGIEDVCMPENDVSIRIRRYECAADGSTPKKTTLKNVKIELETVIINLRDYVPESHRRRNVLKNNMNDNFLSDINNMTLVTTVMLAYFCYDINIYDGEKLIITFETNGRTFYDRKNKLMYTSKENLLRKYWGISEENACR